MAYFLRNLFLFGFILSIPSALFAQSPLLRINAGGAEASSEGTTFISDTFFSDSKTAVITLEADVSGTEADVLFESERISPDDLSPFSYSIPVPDGNYTVSLHFAETTFKNEAKRLFNVEVEGDAVLEDYDIFTASGGQNVSIVETIPNVSVNDGSLDITFISELERAKVNAIEIFGSALTQYLSPLRSMPATPSIIRPAASPSVPQPTRFSWMGKPLPEQARLITPLTMRYF